MERKRVAILSNVMVELIRQRLGRRYDVYTPSGFDTWIQDILNPLSGLYQCAPDVTIVLLDMTGSRSQCRDVIEKKMGSWKQAIRVLASALTSTPIFISTIDIRESRVRAFAERSYALEIENDWYQFVQGLAEKEQNVYCLGLADVIADVGRERFYDDKMWYMGGMPYSRSGLAHICEEIQGALFSVFGIKKKMIALDLDNTLWGGVIGEDGIDGIELSDHKEGERFYDFQKRLLEMKERGVLLSVISKNNEQDAVRAIQEHPSMLLRKKDFVALKIDWDSKADDLKEIATDMNLTEAAFIFIDDNPIEREIVSGECPEVSVPDFPEDSTQLIGFAEKIYIRYFRPLRILTEDLNKTEMYQAEDERKEVHAKSVSLEDYIAKLEIKVDIHRMRREEIERVAQLCNKTNQFNLTTKRYTVNEIADLGNDPDSVIFVVYVEDRYGDSGLVSVMILRQEKNTVDIDTFLMSCRVMGRGLEEVIFNEIADAYKGTKERISARYIETQKNKPVEGLYERLGFDVAGQGEGMKRYTFDLSGFKKKDLRVYSKICFDGREES